METPKDVFAEIQSRLDSDPDKFKEEVDGSFKFVLESGTWVVDAKDNIGVREEDGDADVTITVSDEDFVAISDGSLDGMQAFMLGKVQVDGDMGLAMKLQQILG